MMIRKMTYADVPKVAEIERECFAQPWSEHAFTDSLANESTCFLVAQEMTASGDLAAKVRENADSDSDGNVRDKIAGYAGMYASFEEGEITNVAVAERFRKNGVGEALIRRMLAEAKTLGVTRVILEVRTSNAPAIALYHKCGFQKIGIRKGFYDFPKEDADIMEWKAGTE